MNSQDAHRTVATAAGYGSAAVGVLCWILQLTVHLAVPDSIVASMSFLATGVISLFLNRLRGDET